MPRRERKENEDEMIVALTKPKDFSQELLFDRFVFSAEVQEETRLKSQLPSFAKKKSTPSSSSPSPAAAAATKSTTGSSSAIQEATVSDGLVKLQTLLHSRGTLGSRPQVSLLSNPFFPPPFSIDPIQIILLPFIASFLPLSDHSTFSRVVSPYYLLL